MAWCNLMRFDKVLLHTGGQQQCACEWWTQTHTVIPATPSDLTPEPSRASECSLEGYTTAQSAFSASLSQVQQHIRRLSAQSLSGFSDTDTPRHAEPAGSSQAADSAGLVNANHMQTHVGTHGRQQPGSDAWGMSQQPQHDRLVNATDWGRGAPQAGGPHQPPAGM